LETISHHNNGFDVEAPHDIDVFKFAPTTTFDDEKTINTCRMFFSEKGEF
jgi:hypothetical protein